MKTIIVVLLLSLSFVAVAQEGSFTKPASGSSGNSSMEGERNTSIATSTYQQSQVQQPNERPKPVFHVILRSEKSDQDLLNDGYVIVSWGDEPVLAEEYYQSYIFAGNGEILTQDGFQKEYVLITRRPQH